MSESLGGGLGGAMTAVSFLLLAAVALAPLGWGLMRRAPVRGRRAADLALHRAASYFIGYSYNFCWAVRTLRVREPDGPWQPRTPAMAAGLSDHIWSLEE